METLVIAHRSVFEQASRQPWSALLTQAERGATGLRVWQGKRGDEPTSRPRSKDEPYDWLPGWDDWADIALLRENDARTGVVCLFKQNWFTRSSRPMSTDPAVVAEWEKS